MDGNSDMYMYIMCYCHPPQVSLRSKDTKSYQNSTLSHRGMLSEGWRMMGSTLRCVAQLDYVRIVLLTFLKLIVPMHRLRPTRRNG